MRITQGLVTDHFLRNLQTNLSRLDRFYEQLSSGKRIRVASDDPAGAAKAMRLRSSLFATEEYQQNVSDAKAWLADTDAALADVTSTMQHIRELAVRGATDTLGDTERQAIADEVNQLLGHLVEVANSKHGSSYLFSGEMTQTAPYEVTTNTNGSPDPSDPTYDPAHGDITVTYGGDTANVDLDPGDQEPNGRMAVELSPGVELEYNVLGNEVFGDEDGGLFAAVIQLRDDLRAGDIEAVGGADLAALEQSIDNMLRWRSEIGAKVNRLEATDRRLGDMAINVEEHLSDVEDVDIAKLITDLKMQESVYRAALATGARIIQPTLVDFMR